MDPISNTENGIVQNQGVVNEDIYLMIIERLGTKEALAKMADLCDEIKTKTEGTTQRILADSQKRAKARGQPYRARAWQGFCARVSESVARKSAEKASGDVLVNAYVGFLATAVARETLEVEDLNVLGRFHLLISKLTKVNLARMSSHCSASFAKIRQLNPNAVWLLDYTNNDTIPWMSNSKAIDGLMGTINVVLYHSQEFPLFDRICEKCHPDCLTLNLSLRNRSNETVKDLAHHMPIFDA